MKRTILSITLTLAIFLHVGAAFAQDTPEYVPDKLKIEEEMAKKLPGWHPMLKASGNLGFSHNSNVVGNADGSTWNLGLAINGGLDFIHKAGHVWSNTLGWQLSYMKTPLLNDFVKSLDAFDFSSTYMYRIPSIDWLGPYAQFAVKTAIFPGYDIRAEDTTVKKLDSKGGPEALDANGDAVTESYPAQKRIDLTDSFAPTILRESAGLFADAVSRKIFALQIRLGAGLWETYGRDGYVIADDDTTTELELKNIQDTFQAGAELKFRAEGVYKKFINYTATAEFMYPFYNNADTTIEGIDLLNKEFAFLLGVKLSEYFSLDYTFKAFQLPLISEEWQIQNGLLLTATLGIL